MPAWLGGIHLGVRRAGWQIRDTYPIPAGLHVNVMPGPGIFRASINADRPGGSLEISLDDMFSFAGHRWRRPRAYAQSGFDHADPGRSYRDRMPLDPDAVNVHCLISPASGREVRIHRGSGLHPRVVRVNVLDIELRVAGIDHGAANPGGSSGHKRQANVLAWATLGIGSRSQIPGGSRRVLPPESSSAQHLDVLGTGCNARLAADARVRCASRGAYLCEPLDQCRRDLRGRQTAIRARRAAVLYPAVDLLVRERWHTDQVHRRADSWSSVPPAPRTPGDPSAGLSSSSGWTSRTASLMG